MPRKLTHRDSQGTVHSDVIGYEVDEAEFRVVADVFGGQENAGILAAEIVRRFNGYAELVAFVERFIAIEDGPSAKRRLGVKGKTCGYCGGKPCEAFCPVKEARELLSRLALAGEGGEG